MLSRRVSLHDSNGFCQCQRRFAAILRGSGTLLSGLTIFTLAVLGFGAAQAQTPIPLPNTATTVAGGGGSISAGAACSAGSPYKAADSYGDGCPGLDANFSTDLRGGIAADGQGNIYISDTSNSMIRKYDPKSGIISRVAGKGSNCTTGLEDSSGDGCVATSTSLSSTPRGIATDPYGNVLIAGYGTEMIHIVCETASPLCPGTTGISRLATCIASPAASVRRVVEHQKAAGLRLAVRGMELWPARSRTSRAM